MKLEIQKIIKAVPENDDELLEEVANTCDTLHEQCESVLVFQDGFFMEKLTSNKFHIFIDNQPFYFNTLTEAVIFLNKKASE